MKKKTARKRPAKSSNSYFRYFVIGFIFVILVLAAKVTYQAFKGTGVLGTSSFLAKDSQTQDGNFKDQRMQTPEPQKTNQPDEVKTPEPVHLNSEVNREVKPSIPPHRVEIQTERNKTEINAAAQGSRLELKTEDNGALSIKMKKSDGTEVQLQRNGIDKINEVLKENDVEIGTNSAKEFEITNKDTKAVTQFPLSVNLSTRMLSVDTPAGTKDLTVLPDQAVQNLLSQGVLSKVSQSVPSTAGAQLQLVELRLFANNPVFQVQGVDNKNLFGFFPIGVQKTALHLLHPLIFPK